MASVLIQFILCLYGFFILVFFFFFLQCLLIILMQQFISEWVKACLLIILLLLLLLLDSFQILSTYCISFFSSLSNSNTLRIQQTRIKYWKCLLSSTGSFTGGLCHGVKLRKTHTVMNWVSSCQKQHQMFGITYSEKSILQISTFPKDFSLQTYSTDAVVGTGELLNSYTGRESIFSNTLEEQNNLLTRN